MITQKTVPSKLYLTQKQALTIPEIPEFAKTARPALEQACETLKLTVIGPVEFIYNGVGCGNETVIELRIAVPIQARKAVVGEFEYFTSNLFTCVCTDFKGSLRNISHAWNALYAAALDVNVIPTTECREVFHQRVDFDSEINMLELQLGINLAFAVE